ncbi:MAG: hypothetical protein ACON4J_03430 [Parvibaculales bacterium]
MVKRFFNILVLTFLLLIVLVLAFANDQTVTFSLDPFSRDNPAIAFELPLFGVFMFALMLGALLGGVLTRIKLWQKTRNSPK